VNKLKQLLCLGCCVFSTMFFLAGCGGTNPGQGQQTATKPATDEGLAYKSFEELDGKKMGVATGTILDKITNKYLPHSPLAYYNNTADMVYALKSGKIEGFLGDEPVVRSLVASNTGIGYFKKKVQDDQYGVGISKKKPELKQIIDEALTRYRQDGTLKKVDTAWFGTDESLKKMPEPKTGARGTVRVAVSPDTPPLDYIKDGEVTGYEPYLVRKILQDAGYTVTFITMDFGGLMPALASGKADIIISTITITEERKKSLLFSEPDYVGGIVLVVKNKNSASDGEDIWTGLKSSFTKNFLLEDRYKLIGQGPKEYSGHFSGVSYFWYYLGLWSLSFAPLP
jgi:ABC-type amino acid transport substrate-binding protein